MRFVQGSGMTKNREIYDLNRDGLQAWARSWTANPPKRADGTPIILKFVTPAGAVLDLRDKVTANHRARVNGGVKRGEALTKDFDDFAKRAGVFLDAGAVVKSLKPGEAEAVAKGLDVLEKRGERLEEIAAFRADRMKRSGADPKWSPPNERRKLLANLEPKRADRYRKWLDRLETA